MADAKTEKQKVQEITEKLEQGIKELFESEKYKTYLNTMSKFHNYSFNNTMLIAMQKPDATLVAGFKAWQKNFDRHVKKGEKGIRILAPAPYKIKEEQEKLDPITGEIMLDKNGMPITEEVEIKIPAFRVVPVFDVSQTDGKELPDIGVNELSGSVEDYEDFMQALTEVSPVPITYEDIDGDAKGYFHTTDHRIAIQEGMSQSQTVKTAIHEVAHAKLHDREQNQDIDTVLDKDRNTKEVEAESVAYTVCQHFGIDTSDYSFGYIAGWSSDRDMKELKSSLDTIRKTASELITGIEDRLAELQKDRAVEQGQELEESLANREAQLLFGGEDRFGIYQLKDTEEARDIHFMGMDYLESKGIAVTKENYDLVYVGELSKLQGQSQGETLEAVYEKFNIDHPEDFRGHSLSVSDVVVLHQNGENSAHFVDSFGFTGLPDFMRELEGVKEQETEKAEDRLTDGEKHFLETDNAPLIAKKFLAWDEIEDLGYRFFEDGYIDKFKPSEKALYGDGMVPELEIYDIARRMQGGEDIREELAKALIGGHEQVTGVGENDAVAVFGKDAVTDTFGNAKKQISYEEIGTAFLSLIENEYKDIEQARAAEEHEEEIAGNTTFGHDVQKLKSKQTEQDEPKKSTETLQFENTEDGDEIIDLGDEADQVLAEMKKSLTGEQETELAFQIADRFISIQETEGGYDYSIMGADYKEIDGGVYDNPDVTIREALDDIVTDLKENPFDNGARGNISDKDELIPIDYDGLMEKGAMCQWHMLSADRSGSGEEAADRIESQAQESVVENFKAKTNELFHEISEMNPAEIEETVKCHVQAEIDETGIDAEIVDAVVVGSRCRGLEREGSDLDVVVELSTDEREDVLFDMFNEAGLHIGGVKVDINPITAQRTGTLETYLPQVEDYLEGVRKLERTILQSYPQNKQNRK